MAIIQSTDFTLTIEPVLSDIEFDFGPTDYVAANAVLLTREMLRTVGAYPPRVGHDWQCNLWLYQTIDGVKTIVDAGEWTLDATYWDAVTRVAVDLPIGHGLADGQMVITLLDSPVIDAVAGMYDFAVQAISALDIFDVCSGKLEILPTIPTIPA